MSSTDQAVLELVMRLQDEVTEGLKDIKGSLVDIGEELDDAGEKGGKGSMFGGIVTTAGDVMNAIGFVADAVGGLGDSLIGSNAQFEQYETKFQVLLGSTEEAKERMEELAEFGATTPFELPGVVEADSILQGFGLHSEESAQKFGFAGDEIRTIAGDVASGTGTDFKEMSLLIGKFSAGATGEAISRMQELGITNRDELKKMGLEFSKAGELTSPLPEAMNTVLSLMKDKYGGLMLAQSSTFDGMMSNLQDWVAGTMRQAGKPIFDKLKEGLGQLLEFLNDPSTQAAIEDFVAGLADALDMTMTIAGVVLDNAVPALQALGVATIYYAATQIPVLIAKLTTMIPLLYAKAAALTASLGPLALVAAAAFGVAKAWDSFSDKVENATDKLLESREWWNKSTTTLARYEEQSEAVQEALQGQADNLEALRSVQRAELESLGQRMAAGLVSEEQYKQEMEAINSKTVAIQVATDKLNADIDAIVQAERAMELTTAGVHQMRDSLKALAADTTVSEETWKEYIKQLTEIQQKGPGILAELAGTQKKFFEEQEDRHAKHRDTVTALQKELEGAKSAEQAQGIQERLLTENQAFDDSEAAAAESYISQQTAQRQHLAMMLIDYINAQALVNDTFKEHSGALITAISEQYGIQVDSSQVAFGSMLGHIDEYVSAGGGDLDTLMRQFEATTSATEDLQVKTKDLTDKYIADVNAKFPEATRNTDAYRKALEAIPARVRTELELQQFTSQAAERFQETKESQVDARIYGRASGGPIAEDDLYRVFDTGGRAEVVLHPGSDGYVLNPDQSTTYLSEVRRQAAAGARADQGAGGDRPIVIHFNEPIIIREEADIDKVAKKVRDKFRRNG